MKSSSSDIHSHRIWNELVKQHVSDNGYVDYKEFKNDLGQIENYLLQLSNNVPDKTWSDMQQLAYWINAYNAFTVQLILKNYGVESIREIQTADIKSPWKIPFISIGGETYTLDKIEHDILRKQFNEPRIHFAIVCGSYSCPKFRNEAFVAEKLNDQLNDQTHDFIHDQTKNNITATPVRLSNIFKWYADDFRTVYNDDRSLLQWISQFTDQPINPDAAIEYLPYNCALNGR